MDKLKYTIKIAGIERDLPLCKLDNDEMIAAFVIFGDVEITTACATELLKRAPEFDYMIAPEAKAIPLIHEMARQAGAKKYMLVRKVAKFYMDGVFSVDDNSITTAGIQKLYLDGADAKLLKDKRVLIIDDVVSTGGSLAAVEALVKQAGGNIVGKMTILAEGPASKRDDVIFLERLPLFDKEGNPKPFD